MTPTAEMFAMAQRIADGTGYQSITREWHYCYTCALAAIMESSEKAACVAESVFDDRGNGRSGHHSEIDWTDGYRDATRAAARAIRNGEHLR